MNKSPSQVVEALVRCALNAKEDMEREWGSNRSVVTMRADGDIPYEILDAEQLLRNWGHLKENEVVT